MNELRSKFAEYSPKASGQDAADDPLGEIGKAFDIHARRVEEPAFLAGASCMLKLAFIKLERVMTPGVSMALQDLLGQVIEYKDELNAENASR